MSFRFLNLTLRDWLVYEGSVSVRFTPVHENHNVWVIYGLNGYGKTSLLRAIQWLFHDAMPDRYIRDCFNASALRAGRNELSVSAEFTYNGRHYHLIRRAIAQIRDEKVVGYPRTSVELAVDRQIETVGIADKIDQILPKECQQFFFFDGLEIEKYAADVHTEETREAIETVLGIPEIRNLAEDLGKLSLELERERDQLLQEQTDYQDVRAQKDQAELDLQRARETLHNLLEKHDHLQQQIDRLEERASRLERIRDEITYLRDLRRRQEDLDERLEGYGRELQQYALVVAQRLTLPLLRQRQDQLDREVSQTEQTSRQVTRTQAQMELLQDLLHEADCVCGRELDEKARHALQERLATLKEQVAASLRVQERTGSYGSVVRERESLAGRIRFIESQADPKTIQSALLNKYNLQVEREEVEQEIALREGNLAGSQDADVGQVFQMLGEKRQSLRELEAQIARAQDEVKATERALDEHQRALNQAAQSIDDKSRVVDVLQQTMNARQVADEMVTRMLQLRREAIETHMTDVFRTVTNKRQEYDRIALSEDFAPTIVTYNNQVMHRSELSAGEKEVLAFSFIAGLNQSTESNAPLVMDTPFGHLDVRHRDGLLQALPKLPCQVILLATDRDLPEAELPNLSHCLGGCLSIVRDEISQRSYIEPCPVR